MQQQIKQPVSTKTNYQKLGESNIKFNHQLAVEYNTAFSDVLLPKSD